MPRRKPLQAPLSTPRTPTDLEQRLHAIVAASMNQVAAAVRQHIAAQLTQTMGGKVRSTATPAAPKGPKSNPGKGGPPRLLDDGMIESVYDVVKSTPGLRSEQVMQHLPLTPKLVKLAPKKLRDAKRIKMQGQKRGATYSA